MIDKKILIVPESLAVAVTKTIDVYDCWYAIDMIIVSDTDYDVACELAESGLPKGKIMRKLTFGEETNP